MSEGFKFTLVMIGIVVAFVTLMSTLISLSDSHAEVEDSKGCLVIEKIDNRIGPGKATRTVNTYCPVEAK